MISVQTNKIKTEKHLLGLKNLLLLNVTSLTSTPYHQIVTSLLSNLFGFPLETTVDDLDVVIPR